MVAMSRRYWLMKTEPDVFGIDDLMKRRIEPWTGVRNYQARNFMRDQMKCGDLILFYHSSTEPPGVAGLARVCREGYVDPTAFDVRSEYFDPKSNKKNPTWMMVDVEFLEKFARILPLEELRSSPALEGMLVLRRGQRLSVQPVEEAHFKEVVRLAGATIPV
jgi:predicted RNA-binding protein with PUA-like domain